jgi:hypothetical protein
MFLMEAFSSLHFKSKAIVYPHRHTNILYRHAFTFEVHGTAAMGKIRVPGNIIMNALMTGIGHSNRAISGIEAGISLHRLPRV